jgi:hypothetical protein
MTLNPRELLMLSVLAFVWSQAQRLESHTPAPTPRHAAQLAHRTPGADAPGSPRPVLGQRPAEVRNRRG